MADFYQVVSTSPAFAFAERGEPYPVVPVLVPDSGSWFKQKVMLVDSIWLPINEQGADFVEETYLSIN